MIRCVRIWTGDDGNSHFEEGVIDLEPGQRGDMLSGRMATTTISFQETASGGAFAWHTAPVRQLVITLSGTLDFQTREGEHFLIRPGDILFAEDTVGSGHSWRLTDDQPWRRAYVVLQPGTPVPFRASNHKASRPDRDARETTANIRNPAAKGDFHARHIHHRTRCRPHRRRHHERDARRVSQGTGAVAQHRNVRNARRAPRSRARKPGTTPAPATPPIAS